VDAGGDEDGIVDESGVIDADVSGSDGNCDDMT
jgi:hypothetical protein